RGYFKVHGTSNVVYPYKLGSWRLRRAIKLLKKHRAKCRNCDSRMSEYEEIYRKEVIQRDLAMSLEYFAIMHGVSEARIATMLRKRLNTAAWYKPAKDDLEPVLRIFGKKSKVSLRQLHEMIVQWLEKKFPQ